MKRKYFFLSYLVVLTLFLSLINHQRKDKAVNNDYYPEVTILMYHFFTNKDNKKGQYTVTSQTLRKDLEYLKNNDFNVIVVKDLIDYVYNGKILPKNPVILSVDDSSLSFYKIMYPMLKEYNMKAVLSVVGYYSEEETNNGFHMHWDQLKEVEASGYVELQNHSYNLHDYGNGKYGIKQYSYESNEQYKERLRKDFLTNNEKLTKLNNIKPTTFTYPLGYSTKVAKELIKEMGFLASFSCAEKKLILKSNVSLFDMPRFNRDGRFTTAEMFENIEAK